MTAQPQIESTRLFSYPEGLSDRAVRDITQDTEGFLWVATDNGLNRYDGYRFQVFDSNIGSRFRLGVSQLKKVRASKNGRLAVVTNQKQPSLELVDTKSFESKLIKPDASAGVKGILKDIFFNKAGEVFAVSVLKNAFHFYQLDPAGQFVKTGDVTWPEFQAPGEMKIIAGSAGNFWMLDTLNGLAEVTTAGKLLRRFDMNEICSIGRPSDTPYFTSVLYEDSAARLWVAFPFRQGIFQLDSGTNSFNEVTGLPPGEVYSGIWEDKKGQLLLGSFSAFGRLKRLFLVDNEKRVVDYQAVLSIDEKINVIYGQDFRKQLFLGTFVGLYHINFVQRPIRWVLAERQLSENDWDNGISIRNITGDGKGNIYISRELKAWYHLRVPDFEIDTILPKTDSGKLLRLWCCSNLVYDATGYLWGGSCAADLGGMLYRYELSTGNTKVYDIPQKIIRHLVRSRNGGLWLLCGVEDADGSLIHFNPATEQFTVYANWNGENPLKDLLPAYLVEARNGEIWIGTDEGLVRIDPVRKESSILKRGENSLTNDNILVIHQAEDGRLWLGTYGGLNIYDPASGAVKGYSLTDGLSSNIVCGILPDRRGNYWISTFSGLSFFDTKTGLFSSFFRDKGLSFNEFNRLAFYRDHLDNFYFGTLNGLNVFKNEDFRREIPASFPIRLTRIVKTSGLGSMDIKESDLMEINEVELSQGDIQMRLEFALPEYFDPKENTYAVWLEGVDDNWRYLGNQNFIEISRMPAGRYRLRIKAAPAQSFWNKDELILTLVVKEAFWQTTWFQISLPFTILLLSYLVFKLLVARIRRKEREQTSINKKFAALELQALQSQMNPHFVFNSLGAIQYFIQNNNAKAADEYLAKFAKLMRLFLESSKNKYITLKEEIKLLSLYIELEQMRFGDKFEAKIQVDDEIDIHSCEIPSVLIQPFVENAINHGLFHKKSKGHLLVRFSDEEDGMVTCVVEDDGIGRRQSRILKEKMNGEHKSMGMQLVKERLDVLRQMDELKIQFEIEDIDDASAGKTGTRVIIKVPFMD